MTSRDRVNYRDRVTGPSRLVRDGTGALTAVVVAPLVLLSLRLALFARSTIFPFSDVALIELNVRDVGHHAVLTGPYSRFGWHHLGPAMFYVLALPYRILDQASAGVYVGALLWNVAMVVGIVLIAHRRGGKPFAWWTIAIIALYLAALSPAVLSSPWNPLIVLLSFVLIVMMAWSLALGDITMLPWIFGLGSFVVQSHIGDLAAVAIAVAFGLVGCALRRVPSRRWMTAGVITVVVLAVMWIPPAIDQASDPGGNFTAVVSWFSHSNPEHGVRETTPVVVRELGGLPARALGTVGPVSGRGAGGSRNASWPFGVLTAVLLVGAGVLARRRREHDALVFCALSGLLVVASVFVLTRAYGPLTDYLTVWTSGLGVTAWLAIGAVATSSASSAPRFRYASATAVALIGLVSAGNVVAAMTTDAPATTFASRSVDRIADEVIAGLPSSGAGRRVYVVADSLDTWPWMAGLVVQLEGRGVPVRVAGWELMVGSRRSAARAPQYASVVTLAGPASARRYRDDPTQREVGSARRIAVFVRAP